MKKTKVKLYKVKSLADLQLQARTYQAYRKLALIAAANLGGPSVAKDDLAAAMQWLYINAMETDEAGVVDEVNFCLDLVTER